MKRCPNCDIQFSDADLFCSKCGTRLETVPEVRTPDGADRTFCKVCGGVLKPDDQFCGKCGSKVCESEIARQKENNTSSSESDAPGISAVPDQPASTEELPGDSPLESARASFQAGEYLDCIRQLEDLMASGDTGARRMFGCFLDDSEAFRRAAESHRYSDLFPSSSRFGGSPSSSAGSGSARASQSSAQPDEIASSSSDPEAIFREGLAAFGRKQYESAFQSFRRASEDDSAKAQFYLGECYSGGPPKDTATRILSRRRRDRAAEVPLSAIPRGRRSRRSLAPPLLPTIQNPCSTRGWPLSIGSSTNPRSSCSEEHPRTTAPRRSFIWASAIPAAKASRGIRRKRTNGTVRP